MKTTLEKQLLEKLGPGSYLGIVRDGNVHVGELKEMYGLFGIDVLTNLTPETIIPYIAIGTTEEVVLGNDLFKKFGGLKKFRYAICFLPRQSRIFPRYTDEDYRAMYSEERNQIVSKIMETERRLKEIQQDLSSSENRELTISVSASSHM